jgi:plasmid stability protein
MDRVMADCRRFESEANCQLTIIGPADDVVAAAVQHAVASHGHQDTPEMREQLRTMLEPESAYVPGERTAEPFPA